MSRENEEERAFLADAMEKARRQLAYLKERMQELEQEPS